MTGCTCVDRMRVRRTRRIETVDLVQRAFLLNDGKLGFNRLTLEKACSILLVAISGRSRILRWISP